MIKYNYLLYQNIKQFRPTSSFVQIVILGVHILKYVDFHITKIIKNMRNYGLKIVAQLDKIQG